MSVLKDLEALAAKAEAEAKIVFDGLIAKVTADRATWIGNLEAEVQKGSAELKAIWAKVKVLL